MKARSYSPIVPNLPVIASKTDPSSSRRVVLLGASNLTRGISTVVETSQRALGQPLEFLVAMGHGRSYGVESCVFGKKISGIFSCGLWPALAAPSRCTTSALITDIGNDILYGMPVQQIVTWVEACVNRLRDADAEIILTQLPLDRARRITPWQFRIMRSLLYPRNRQTLDHVVGQTRELAEQLCELAEKQQITLIPVNYAWFGFDPIHIRRRFWSIAWCEILAHWPSAAPIGQPASGSLVRWLYLSSLTPERRRVWGIKQRTRQPAGRLFDGSTIALY